MNALGFYHILRENGIPDSQIVLMIADDYVTNPRNPYKNGMYVNGVKPDETWYNEKTELDIRGSDVTVQNFFDAVLGTGSKSLQTTNEESHLLILLTGHGGDNFFKFQDEEELTSKDIANLVEELTRRKKFQKLLLIADTCQAFTLFDKLPTTTPNNVYALGTSLRKENAYAHHSDIDIGLSVIERWTYGFLNQYRKRPKTTTTTTTTLYDLMVAPFEGPTGIPLGANVGTLGDFREIRLEEFFGSPLLHEQISTRKDASPSNNNNNNMAISPVQSSPIPMTRIGVETPRLTSTPRHVSSSSYPMDMTAVRDDDYSSPLEPGDTSFCLLVGGMFVLLILAIGVNGKSQDVSNNKNHL